MNLSKTRYCKGVRCPKILWLDEHKSEFRNETALNQAVLNTGKKVGDLVRGYYGSHTEVPCNENKQGVVQEVISSSPFLLFP
jgi:hypothetical protein